LAISLPVMTRGPTPAPSCKRPASIYREAREEFLVKKFRCRRYKTKRSAVMSRIRASGNRDTELRMVALFRQHGITGWRRNARVFGKPDFIFSREKLAVFVDGCFWHRHEGCKFAYTPKSQLEFWAQKFQNNAARDKIVTQTLRESGWKVVRIWECQLHQRHWPKIAQRVARLRESRRSPLC
jgi:DNA mismatch endonuclease, patch repair protein